MVVRPVTSKGFSLVLPLIVVLILSGLGLAWWLASHGKPESKNGSIDSAETADRSEKPEARNEKIISLDKGTASIRLPGHWEYKQGISDCPYGATAKVKNCVDGGLLISDQKVVTPYSAADNFTALIGVFTNEQYTDPKSWLQEGMDEGRVEVISSEATDDQSVLFAKNSFKNSLMHFVLMKGDTVVYLRAQTYEASVLESGTKVDDTMRFEPLLIDVFRTVSIGRGNL